MYYPVKIGKISDAQMKNLIKGRGVRIKKGVDAVLHLSEQQIKKLERASKKGAASVVNFDPYQASQYKTTMGSGLNKNIVKGLKKTGKYVGKYAISEGIPIAFSLGSMALGDPSGMSGNALGNIVADQAGKAYERDVMSKGAGVFKTIRKTTGIKRGAIIKGLKESGSIAASIGSQLAGDAVSMYTGNPALGQKFTEISNSAAQSAIQGNLRKGLQDAGRSTKQEAIRFAVESVDDQIDKRLTGRAKVMAENMLANKYGSARDLVYDMSEMYTGTGMKLKKRVGRPSKKGGALYPAGSK
jgi:hypothetical protein